MRTRTETFKNEWKNQNRTLKYSAELVLKDGTALQIADSDLIQPGGFQLEEHLSGKDGFDICPVISKKLTLCLNNANLKFSAYHLEGAVVTAYAGLLPADQSVENICMGKFYVEKALETGTKIRLVCPDNIRRLDRPYLESKLPYPATLEQIVKNACEVCGLSFKSEGFENSTYRVKNRPSEATLSFRDVVAWAAQIAGKYVTCDETGGLQFGWYAESGQLGTYMLTDERENPVFAEDALPIAILNTASEEGALAEGGVFDSSDSYLSGETLDGGTFSQWNNAVDYDGGDVEGMNMFHHIVALNSCSMGENSAKVTGIRVVMESMNGDRMSYLSGDAGYVFEILKNRLIQTEAQAQMVSEFLWGKVSTIVLCQADVKHHLDPSIEAGDLVYISDKSGDVCRTFLTDTVYISGENQRSLCRTLTRPAQEMMHASDLEKAAAEAKKSSQEQIGFYDESLQALTDLMVQVLGVFKTRETAADGSSIYYLRRKQQPDGSNAVWKISKEGFLLSEDGGTTWKAGTDSNGNVITDVFSMLGVKSDGIRTGRIMAKGDDATNVLLGSGTVTVNAGTFKMGEATGKSGWARFSDGSYLEFKNGILIGGKTASGTAF